MSNILDNEWFRNGETTGLPLDNSTHQLRLNYKGDKQRYANSQELGIADGGNGKGIYVSTWAHMTSGNVSRGVRLAGIYNDTGAPTSTMIPQTGSAQYFTGAGTEADHEITVNDDAGAQTTTGYTDEYGVDIIVDKENQRFIVVWSYASSNAGTNNREIWARIFDYTLDTASPENCTITKWSASWLVANTNGPFMPRCCKSSNGFVICYPVDNGSNQANIKAIIVSSTDKNSSTLGHGTPTTVTNEFTVNNSAFNYKLDNLLRVSANCDELTNGDLAFIWSYNDNTTVSKLKAQITDINGTALATEFEIDDNLVEYTTYGNEPIIYIPEVLKMNTANKFIVVWSNKVNNKWCAYRQQFEYSNSLITATNSKLSVAGNSLTPPNTNHGVSPAVGVFSDDSYVIAFQYHDGGNWNTSTRIFLSDNTQDPETTNSTPNVIHDGGGQVNESNLDIVVFSNDDFLVTFQADNRGGSSGSDVYGIYFTYQGNALDDSLIEGVGRAIDSYTLFDDTEYFTKDVPNKTVTLKKDMNWQTLIEAEGGSWFDYIDMTPSWTFDGANYNIIINDADNGATTFKGLFKVISTVTTTTRPTIKNFTIKRHDTHPVILEKNCGYIVRGIIHYGLRNPTKSFIMENCTTHSNLTINSNCGGLCGSYISDAGDVLIKDCTNNIALSSERCGGICGPNGAYNAGSLMIIGCTNTGTISGKDAAGIIASYFNSSTPVSGSGELVTITKCTNSGDVSGEGAGGIFGSRFRNSIASYCTNSGAISGTNAGGIFGDESYYQSGGTKFSIRNCTNSGAITGTSAGGLLGNNSVKHGDIVISNSKNTGNITGSSAGGFFGGSGCIGIDGSLTSVIIKNSYCIGQVGVDGGNVAGGFFGSNACGNGVILTIQDCYYKGDVQNGSAVFGSNFSNDASSASYKNRINVSSCYFIATGTATTTAQAVVNVDSADEYWTMLISHCYISGFSNNGFIKTSANSANICAVISNCYSINDILYNLGTTSGTNDQYIVYNSYSSSGSGANPKTGTNSSSGTINGNSVVGNINSSSALTNGNLNSQVTLATLQAFSTLNATIWPTQQPKQSTSVYTYDSAILLTCFQSNPWSSYTAIDSASVLGTATNSNHASQVIQLIISETTHTVGGSTFSSGNPITSIFNTQAELDDWFNGAGDNPSSVNDITLVDDIPVLQSGDYPSVTSKSFVTEKSSITVLEDDGNQTYVFSEELGNVYNITYNGNNYTLKFILYGSGGIQLTPSGGGESGGDPHIIPIMQPGKVLTLPCDRQGINYNYLTYCNGEEKLSINIMTWLVRFNLKKDHSITDQKILDYIKTDHSYIRYVMFNYQNGDKLERLCFDLTEMKTVDSRVDNFEQLAFLCKLPFRKYETFRIMVSDTYHSNNNRIIKYKTKNSPQKDITIYMNAAKFVLTLGVADDNVIFNNYVQLKEYPKSLLTKGSGLLVSCKEEEMGNFVIKSLKSL